MSRGSRPIKPLRSGVLALGVVFRSLCWFVAAVGCLLLLGLGVGWLPVCYIQFAPPGTSIARRRWAYTIPWDRISRISAGEFHDNVALFIWLRDADPVIVHRPDRKAQVAKHFASNVT